MNLVEFECEVRHKIYAWVEAKDYLIGGGGITTSGEYGSPRMGPYLITEYLPDDWPASVPTRRTKQERSEPLERKWYRPLSEYTGLFRMFAEMKPEQEDILVFARKFGHLGVNDVVTFRDPKSLKMIKAVAEPLVAWTSNINLMKDVVTTWDWIRKGNVARLERHLETLQDGVLRYNIHSGQGLQHHTPVWMTPLGAPALDHTPLRFLSRHANEAVQAGRQFVQKVINGRLARSGDLQLRLDREDGDVGVHIVPQNLVGALWYQCAEAVGGNRSYQCCGACGSWFELSPQTRRSNSLYCSQSCRLRAYRDRMRDARRLGEEGIPIEEISRKLGSEISTIRNWLEKNQSRDGAH